jgi:hypothetical protein
MINQEITIMEHSQTSLKLSLILMTMFLISFAYAGDMGTIDSEPIEKIGYCFDSTSKTSQFVDCKAVDVRDEKYQELTTSIPVVKEDGLYLNEVIVKTEKDASVYIHELDKYGRYHVDNLNKIPVEVYLELAYAEKPYKIEHFDKYGNHVTSFYQDSYIWTPNCKDEYCTDSSGIAKVLATITEESIGSDIFSVGNATSGWVSQGQYYATFDGVDDYVEVAHDASQLCYTTGGFTISAWVNIAGDGEVVGGTSSGRILDKSQLSFAIRGANKNFYLSVNGGETKGQSTDNTALPYGVWKHVLVYYLPADTKAYFYINGVFDRALGAGTPVSNSGVIRIGNAASSTDQTFDGSIADVRIYNKTLNSTEITALYNSHTIDGQVITKVSEPNIDGLVGHWNFDDAKTNDQSGNNNHGTNYGATFTDVLLEYVPLTNGVDYTLDTATGLLTIINTDYLYSWVESDWVYLTNNPADTCSQIFDGFDTQFGIFAMALIGFIGLVGTFFGIRFLIYFIKPIINKDEGSLRLVE